MFSYHSNAVKNSSLHIFFQLHFSVGRTFCQDHRGKLAASLPVFSLNTTPYPFFPEKRGFLLGNVAVVSFVSFGGCKYNTFIGIKFFVVIFVLTYQVEI